MLYMSVHNVQCQLIVSNALHQHDNAKRYLTPKAM